MKKTLILTLFILNSTWAIQATPEILTFVQPDGTTFSGFNKGDEWAGWQETTDGWSVVKDSSGWWTYAGEVRGNRLVPGSRRVYASDNRDLLSVSKHLRPVSRRQSDPAPVPQLTNARTDTFYVPVLLAEFPDYGHQYPLSNFDDLLNSSGYGHPGHPGSGSFREFYNEISYNQFNPISSISDWVDAPENHDYYAYSNPNGYQHVLTLVRALVDSAEIRGMDWSQFDNDGDGTVDALNIIHAGGGAEQGDYSNIWSHKWSLSAGGLEVQYDGVWINSYTINPEVQGANIVAIGVISHEFGHALGLPDLYDTDYSSSGAGQLALMAGGSWGTSGNSPWYPSAMTAWSKAELGWANPILLTEDQIQVPVVQSFSSNLIYRINNIADDSEYWLVENREKIGTDINMPSPGLLFWHIDTEKTEGWGVNNDEPHFGVGLEQADGLYNLENGQGSDGGDPYPGTTVNRTFSYNTVPSTESYYFQPSMIHFSNISDPDSIMTFDVEFGEYLVSTAGITNNSGTSYAPGQIALVINNDMPIGSMELELNIAPGILDIAGVELADRVTADSVIINGTTIQLVNPFIQPGTGNFLTLEVFANTGISTTVALDYAWVAATDTAGNGIGFLTTSGIYTLVGPLQTFTCSNESGTPGGPGRYGVSLTNTVPIKMMIMELWDTPDYLIPMAELFTDTNGNHVWDAGEPFEDLNQDGSWTPMVEFTDRLAGWNTNVAYTSNGIRVAGANNTQPLEPGDGVIFYINNIVDNNAPEGIIATIIQPQMLMDGFGNTGLNTQLVQGQFTILPTLDIESSTELPTAFRVSKNFPNPFNPTTAFTVSVPEEIEVECRIFDVLGREVWTQKEFYGPGYHRIVWKGIDRAGQSVGAGVYFLTVTAGTNRTNQKLLLLK